MYTLEVDDEKVLKTSNLDQIFKYIGKNFGKDAIKKVYHEFYGEVLIEFYYVLNKDKLSCLRVKKLLPKINILNLLRESKKNIKIKENFSLVVKKTKKICYPCTDPSIYGDEGYVRKGCDNYLWVNKLVNKKWIWEDYNSPL